MEHRWGQRRSIKSSVQLRTQGGLVALGRLINVSLSGAFVQTALKAPLFSRVVLTISLDRKHKAHIDGQIVRQTDVGLGVEWHEFGGEQVQAILASHRHRHAREHHTVGARTHRPLNGHSKTR